MLLPKSFLFLLFVFGFVKLEAQQTIIFPLSGADKDHTIDWDFFCTKGHNSGRWTTIPVPSNWELLGFGSYNYGHDKDKGDEQGLYKHHFTLPSTWKNKKIFIVFEGVMTDAEVKINGRVAGPVHQGGFYQFRYDVSDLLKFTDSNLLEVTVSKQSANRSINRAEREGDFWALGGIFRPVYLEVVPQAHIEKLALDAQANGSLHLTFDVPGYQPGDVIEAKVTDSKKAAQGKMNVFRLNGQNADVQTKFTNIETWNPEHPSLYHLTLSLKRKGVTLHTIQQRFGFRTVELRKGDGLYVNGVKVVFKGVDRHSAWPESGRTLSKAISIQDVKLMKEMNMNAVRMSHYPPDQHFLEVCDSLGLFVLDELTGWQAAYDTTVGRKLVKELVERDRNHPSIVLWANGNEGGWNRGLDNDFQLYDLQKRLVYHPWEKFNGTDTKHYPDYNYMVNASLYSTDVFFPTEFMHGLYDGGHAAGLYDFWSLMLKHPSNAGGFLWSFADEGVVRTDKNGVIDTDGNHAPDGILGPHREKEASYFAIKEIWSPVYIELKKLAADFQGKLLVENRFLYSDLKQVRFNWKLISYSSVNSIMLDRRHAIGGKASLISAAPGEKKLLDLQLPGSWKTYDVLEVEAHDLQGSLICQWSWPIISPSAFIKKVLVKAPSATAVTHRQEGDQLVIQNGTHAYYFNKTSGLLDKLVKNDSVISLSGGPVLAGTKLTLQQFTHTDSSDSYLVHARFAGEGRLNIDWTIVPGQPIRMDYSYERRGETDFTGITFNYPEEQVVSMTWLGRGPYRVWKNRMQGMQFGRFEKKYNNTITGESWIYPEFKGFHADLYWAVIKTKEGDIAIYNEQENTFLQLLKPEKPKGATNDNTSPPFPDGNIGIMQAIPPIGTKFQAPNRLGPQSQRNMQLNYTPVTGRIWLDF